MLKSDLAAEPQRSRRTVEGFAITAMVAVLATTDWLGSLTLHGSTGTALLSTGFATALLLFLVARLRHDAGTYGVGWPLVVLVGWAIARTTMTSSWTYGAQNIVVLTVFAAGTIAASRESFDGVLQPARLTALVRWSGVAASVIYLLTVARGGFGTSSLFGARSFALVGVLTLAVTVADRRPSRRHVVTIAVVLGAVVASLSRTGIAACLVLLIASPIARPILRRPRWLRSTRAVFTAVVTLALLVLAVQRVGPLHDRVFAGDRAISVRGTRINASGRAQFWSVTFDDAKRNLVIGAGAGSSEELMRSRFNDVEHPHNDYLRLLHDYGLVGVGLVVCGVMLIVRSLRHGRRRPKATDADRALLTSGLLALLGLGLVMITDNVIVYVFVMAPAACVIGAAIGLSARLAAIDEANDSRRRRQHSTRV